MNKIDFYTLMEHMENDAFSDADLSQYPHTMLSEERQPYVKAYLQDLLKNRNQLCFSKVSGELDVDIVLWIAHIEGVLLGYDMYLGGMFRQLVYVLIDEYKKGDTQLEIK